MSSPVLWYATRASGLMALVLLTAATVLGVVVANRVATERWPGFALFDLHRRVSGIAVAFLGLHVVTSVADTYVHIGWPAIVVPFTSSYQRGWLALGTIGLDLLLAVGATSVLRARLTARTWRAVHWLAYASWPVALAHAFGMGSDMGARWAAALGATCIAVVVGAVVWRAVRALASHRKDERSAKPTPLTAVARARRRAPAPVRNGSFTGGNP